ncbi:unnamed protein product, partial [Pylaiella littoralis]
LHRRGKGADGDSRGCGKIMVETGQIPTVAFRFPMSSPADSDADVQVVTRAEFELQVQAGENERTHLSAEVADLQTSLEAKLATVLTTLQQVQQAHLGGAHGGTQVAGHA